MPKLSVSVFPKEGQKVTDERWAQLLLRAFDMANTLAAEFPEISVSLPFVTGSRNGRKYAGGSGPQGGDTGDRAQDDYPQEKERKDLT